MEQPYFPYGNLVASANVNAAGVVSADTGFGVVGNAALASSVYTYTLSNQIDPTNAIVLITPLGTTAVYASGGVTADNTVVVSTFNAAGAPTDAAHQVSVFRRAML